MAAEPLGTQKLIWTNYMDGYINQRGKLGGNCQNVYNRICGQCTEYTRSKIEVCSDYNKMRLKYYVFLIIEAI